MQNDAKLELVIIILSWCLPHAMEGVCAIELSMPSFPSPPERAPISFVKLRIVATFVRNVQKSLFNGLLSITIRFRVALPRFARY